MSEPRRYRPEILRALAPHGLRPTPGTPPEKAYELLKAIYTFQVRELRVRRRQTERVFGPQPLDDYRRQLHDLLERYPVLRIPAHHWVERVADAPGT